MKFVLAAFLFLLAFFAFPWVNDVNNGAKAYFFFFVSICLFLGWVLREGRLRLDPSIPFWLLLVLSFSVSALFSKNPASAFLLIGVLIAGVLFFILAAEVARSDPGAPLALMRTVLLIALLAAVLGLGQFFDSVFNGRRPGMLIPYLLPGSWGMRISGPFGQPNFHALLMLAGLCAFACIYFLEVSEKASRWVKAGILIPAFLLWLNFFLTDSRGGNVALAALSVTLLWLWSRLKGRLDSKPWRIKGLLFAGAGGMAYLFARTMVFAFFSSKQIAFLQLSQTSSIVSRINTWMTSLLITWDHPWIGVGPDNFKSYLYEYQIKARDLLKFEYEDMLYTRWVHNEYLQILAEGGVLSFSLFLILLLLIMCRVFRKLIETGSASSIFIFVTLVLFFVQAAFDWPLRFTPLLALCLALLAILLQGNKFLEIRLGIREKILVSAFCLVLLTAGTWVFYWDLQLGLLRDRSANEQMAGENIKRLKELSANSFIEFTLLNKGIVPYVNYSVRTNNLAMASELIPLVERAVFLEGAYWQWYNLARVLLVAGKPGEARKAIQKSIDLNPIHEPSWQFLHYLNMIRAAEETGRPFESFFPEELSLLELPDVGDFASKSF